MNGSLPNHNPNPQKHGRYSEAQSLLYGSGEAYWRSVDEQKARASNTALKSFLVHHQVEHGRQLVCAVLFNSLGDLHLLHLHQRRQLADRLSYTHN